MAYGIKVSRPGKSITSTDARDIILDTTKPLLKIKQAGRGTITITGSTEWDYKVDTITHNLGYSPVVMAWTSQTNNGDICFIAMSGLGNGTEHLFYVFPTTTTVDIYVGRWWIYPEGTFAADYKYIIFYDPDNSIAGVGSVTVTTDDMGFLISKPGAEVDGDINEDDVILNSKHRCISIMDIKSGTLTVSSGSGAVNINHGRDGIPCFIPYIKVDSKWYVAGGWGWLPSNGQINTACDSTKARFSMTGENGSYPVRLVILNEMIKGTGGDADDDETYGLLVSKPGSTASSDLADKDRVFYSGKQHFQPYTTKSFSFRLDYDEDTKTSSLTHGFSFNPAFTGRYRYKYPDYGNTWSSWLLLPRTMSDTSDFSVHCYIDSSNVGIRADHNSAMGSNIDIEAEVMIYPIDIG